MEEAQAILGVTIPTTFLCGQDFSDQRYENLKTRFLLRLSPEDKRLMELSTYVDDAMDLFGQVPVVGRAMSRDWYAQVLHVTYAAVLIRDALEEAQKPRRAVSDSLDLDATQASTLRTLLMPAAPVSREPGWLDQLMSPATQKVVASLWSRSKGAIAHSKELVVRHEKLGFALMHLQRGIGGGRENSRVSRSWMVFHAAQLMEKGTGLIGAVTAKLKEKVQFEDILKLPVLTSSNVAGVVSYASKKAPN